VPLEISGGQFQGHTAPRTLQRHARRHDTNRLIEEIHFGELISI
jgi:hypothetical protein